MTKYNSKEEMCDNCDNPFSRCSAPTQDKCFNLVMTGVREYGEEDEVLLDTRDNGRLVILASNEGGYNGTSVDLLDIIAWVKKNKPELL
jgi:hypothetical protein